MGRKVNVYMHDEIAGILTEEIEKYVFTYSDSYAGKCISRSMPTSSKVHESKELHPYFTSLAPEGWLKKRYSETQKIDEKDTFGFLIENGDDLLGAITIKKLLINSKLNRELREIYANR
jgi:serine/threonine-protein kinase HipA